MLFGQPENKTTKTNSILLSFLYFITDGGENISHYSCSLHSLFSHRGVACFTKIDSFSDQSGDLGQFKNGGARNGLFYQYLAYQIDILGQIKAWKLELQAVYV
jgi:hypothetical protein